ncbi:hypothetical protein P344_01290 [Spiroplasma mirum ATCC 29335]|uniref:Uncharacterized protein n=1 Tax=Spiroplasma mirum ATCC 29335 TaxID=838561 RepID=W0GPX0_9MOLU|nr:MULTISPECIES: hypothetical protein [Spiroplasma]AHF60664.1 hypothetical protein SMM_0207 [Spiroplasma mirum ATCC 29335]AHI57623.1 hypothetical protein P344_01290 [Spiroplasma mirum ATCC 29335]
MDYDYSYAFKTRDTNKANLQSFTLLFALSDSDNYVSYNDLQDNVFSFPTLSIGGDDSAFCEL